MGRKVIVGQIWNLYHLKSTIIKIELRKGKIQVDSIDQSGYLYKDWGEIDENHREFSWVWNLIFDPSGENCLEDCCKIK